MRSLEDFLSELESDRLDRESELRLVENLASRAASDEEAQMLRRSLILLAYAHLEGFCKFALFLYAGAINAESLPCSAATIPVMSASLREIFSALRNVQSKSPEFRRGAPDDSDLHMLWRERAFIENYHAILSRTVTIPDKIVDTEHNLDGMVLKKNLYKLGLDHSAASAQESNLNKLVGIRNSIAHGDRLTRPSAEKCRDYLATVFEVMGAVQEIVIAAIRDQKYRQSVVA